MHEQLNEIAAASRRFGSDPELVFGGGGNTSFKTEEHLYIKPSGVSLATMQPDEFVKMDRSAIRAIFDEDPPTQVWEREEWAQGTMAAAVCADSWGRPSVEAPVHEIIPGRFVVHVHPLLVNGLTCAVDGKAACERLFPEAMWAPYVDPGYTLAKTLHQLLEAFAAERGALPSVTFLGNHGVFVGAEEIEEIDAHYNRVLKILRTEYANAGLSTELTLDAPDAEAVAATAPRLRTLLGDGQARAVVHAAGYFEPAAGPLSPDHMVYAKSFAYKGAAEAESLAAFKEKHGYNPVVCAAPDGAVFTVGGNLKSARTSMAAAQNAALVVRLTQAFGGPRFFSDAERGFIENWEVESYRKRLLLGGADGGQRLAGKIALVTGAAQGFGWGIAQGLAAAGATVITADVNEEGASAAAARLEEEFGDGQAFAVPVDVASEESVAAMREAVLAECGGLDILISNAGVLRAGSVKELSREDWDFVTKVNYTGYFECVKHLAPVMAQQHIDGQNGWCDIIQINSKSGLVGSNKNAAYAGSKFGAIGLTQSFALELVEDRIKVNAVCPGNYFDGPLWSDPEKGLFAQYLASGKAPGAKTVEDVKAFYEGKVPMGRGCTPEDVVRAIIYLVEQEYETGQALAVTGGQVMLG